MLSNKQIGTLITLDALILIFSIGVFGANLYFASIIFNPEVKTMFFGLAMFGVVLAIVNTKRLINTINMLPKKAMVKNTQPKENIIF